MSTTDPRRSTETIHIFKKTYVVAGEAICNVRFRADALAPQSKEGALEVLNKELQNRIRFKQRSLRKAGKPAMR